MSRTFFKNFRDIFRWCFPAIPTIIPKESNLFQQFPDILGRKLINRVTELALHREGLSLGGNLLQFLSAQTDEGAFHPLPGAVALIGNLLCLQENHAQIPQHLTQNVLRA